MTAKRSARNEPESNPLVLLLAELAVAAVERRRETAERRAKMAVVGGKQGGRAT